MTQARRALIIAPDDFPLGEYDDYDAACRALNLEPNRHCYVVCRVSTAAGPRTLLTVDLGLLQDTEKADTSDQASLLSAGRSKETASGEPFAASGLEPETTTQVDREAAPTSWEVACLEGTELDKVLGPGAEPKEIKLIQGRIFYDECTQDLWVDRDILTLPPSERSKILEWIQGKSAEGIAEYMAKQVDAVLSQSQLFHFATGSVGGLDLAALDMANLQDGWHEFFIGGPTEKLASALGLPDASLMGDVAGSLPLLFDRLMGRFRLACEIGAVATVMVTGPTPLVLVGEKLLVKDVFHRVVAESISALLTGDGKQPETTTQVDREVAPKENVKPEELREDVGPARRPEATSPDNRLSGPRRSTRDIPSPPGGGVSPQTEEDECRALDSSLYGNPQSPDPARGSPTPDGPGPGLSPDEERLLTPGEVAALFRVDPKTITRWAASSVFSRAHTTSSGDGVKNTCRSRASTIFGKIGYAVRSTDVTAPPHGAHSHQPPRTPAIGTSTGGPHRSDTTTYSAGKPGHSQPSQETPDPPGQSALSPQSHRSEARMAFQDHPIRVFGLMWAGPGEPTKASETRIDDNSTG